MINFLMGNERWILHELKKMPLKEVVELGAGDGILTRKIAELGSVTGLDYQPKPAGFEGKWKAGDIFHTLPKVEGEVVVANLILHHFSDAQLRELGVLLRRRKKFLLVEPYRAERSLRQGRLLWPVINEVTKHDMMVSVRAGFVPGELPDLLDPDRKWNWEEEVSLLGGIRVLAWPK
jgi:SAM-dependent methyltransferase